MLLEEAYAVIDSLGYIDVVYKDRHVWLERINEKDKTAQVREIDTDIMQEVSVDELKENHINL